MDKRGIGGHKHHQTDPNLAHRTAESLFMDNMDKNVILIVACKAITGFTTVS